MDEKDSLITDTEVADITSLRPKEFFKSETFYKILKYAIYGFLVLMILLTLFAFRGSRAGLSTILPFLDKKPTRTLQFD